MLKTCILENYHPGVARVDASGGNSLEFDLLGSPWFSHSGGLHARSLLVHLFDCWSNVTRSVEATYSTSSSQKTVKQNIPIPKALNKLDPSLFKLFLQRQLVNQVTNCYTFISGPEYIEYIVDTILCATSPPFPAISTD